MVRLYEKIVDFIAAGVTSADVASFQPSAALRRKAFDLIDREKKGLLISDEKSELDHYMEIEHLMRLAKARANRRLSEDGGDE